MAKAHSHGHVAVKACDAGKAFCISIALNLLYVLAEVIAGLMYDSMALLTDAGHNISDIASLLLSLFAFRLAKKSPQNALPMGTKKQRCWRLLATPAFY
jgi:cobalt-zinc-cadmium efflux system protein